jgi:hypothetical protein
MKIAVVSTGRSRGTLLAKYLHSVNPDLEFCGEVYNTPRINDIELTGINGNFAEVNLTDLTNELLAKENYIVTIIALSLGYDENRDPSVFKLEEYDQIHLIERHDFFDQCCSWEVASREQLYHISTELPDRAGGFDDVKKRKYKLTAPGIIHAADIIVPYLIIKRYITDNNIPHTLHTYESAKQFDKKQTVLTDPKLSYNELITNYDLKEDINTIFNKHFSYNDMTSNLEAFETELGDVKGLRSIQSFANKMAAKWSK